MTLVRQTRIPAPDAMAYLYLPTNPGAWEERNSMRMLVLGAGIQGSACAFDLLRSSDAEVTLADANPEPLPPFLKVVRGKRLRIVRLDARDHDAVASLFAGHDAVLNALPYYLNLEMAQLAVKVGIHYADLGGNTDIVRKQHTLSDEAEEKKVSIMPDCGLAPGLVNVLAAEGVRRLDEVETVKLFVGGLPQNPQPPLNYNIVYSLEGLLDYYTTPSWIVRDGKPQTVEALSELEIVEFPEPIGRLEAFHTAGGLSTMPWVYEGIPRMEYKTLRYPGHAHLIRTIKQLGLLDTDPIVVDGAEVRPRDVFIAVADPKLRKPNVRDVVALKVTVTGQKSGEPIVVGFDLLDFYDEENEISAMMRTTGYSLSITGQMQVGGRVEHWGVTTAYEGMPFEPYVSALAKRGVDIKETVQSVT